MHVSSTGIESIISVHQTTCQLGWSKPWQGAKVNGKRLVWTEGLPEKSVISLCSMTIKSSSEQIIECILVPVLIVFGNDIAPFLQSQSALEQKITLKVAVELMR